MGLRGPLARAAEQLKPDDESAVLIPASGMDLDPLVDQEWTDFWTSKVSRFTDDVDMGSLRRLFTYRNEWVTLARAWHAMPDEDRVVAGSRNVEALRLHPFTDRMNKLEALMLPLEDRFGLSPLSRARLGIEVGSLHLTWRQVQQAEDADQSPAAGVLPVGSARELNE